MYQNQQPNKYYCIIIYIIKRKHSSIIVNYISKKRKRKCSKTERISNQGACHPQQLTWRAVEEAAQNARAKWSKPKNVLFGHGSLAVAAFAAFAVIVLGARRWFVSAAVTQSTYEADEIQQRIVNTIYLYGKLYALFFYNANPLYFSIK